MRFWRAAGENFVSLHVGHFAFSWVICWSSSAALRTPAFPVYPAPVTRWSARDGWPLAHLTTMSVNSATWPEAASTSSGVTRGQKISAIGVDSVLTKTCRHKSSKRFFIAAPSGP